MKKEANNKYAEKLTDARWRTAQAVGVSESTVTRILSARKARTKKPSTPHPMESSPVHTMKPQEPSTVHDIKPTTHDIELSTAHTVDMDEMGIECKSEPTTSHSNSVSTSTAILTLPMKKRGVKPRKIRSLQKDILFDKNKVKIEILETGNISP